MARDPSVGPPTSPFFVGKWQVHPATDTLTLDQRTVKLEPRTMRLLLALAEEPGAVCASDALLDAVWPGVVVTGHSLYQAIGELRSALRADAATGEFIANVPRKGYRLVAPVTRPAPQAPTQADSPNPRDRAVAPVGARSIAVLPFRDLGLPAAQSFLREMLLGDLVLELSRQPGLTTIARGTMLAYAGTTLSPRRIAEELGVRYVVDGSIAAMGDKLAITGELIDATNETALISESIAIAAADWPEMGQRVAGRIARALRLEISEHAVRTADASPGQAGALELAMRAWVELYCRPQTRATNDRAWAWANEALARDESIGAAWNALAYCEWRAAQFEWHARPWADLLADAVAHATRATALAPGDPDAYYTLALATYTSGDVTRAEATLHHCLQISASYAPAYSLLGLARAVLGFPEETAALCERAFALSPREPLRAVWRWSQACAASMLGRDADALGFATQGIAANAAFPPCHLIAAVSNWRLGDRAAAARHVEALRTSAFRSIALVRRLPPMRLSKWAPAFLADLEAAGLPAR